jgi:hypothetical protein
MPTPATRMAAKATTVRAVPRFRIGMLLTEE